MNQLWSSKCFGCMFSCHSSGKWFHPPGLNKITRSTNYAIYIVINTHPPTPLPLFRAKIAMFMWHLNCKAFLLFHRNKYISRIKRLLTSIQKNCDNHILPKTAMKSTQTLKYVYRFQYILWSYVIDGQFVRDVDVLQQRLQWASYQIRKIAGCACARNAGNVFPATDFKGNRWLAIPTWYVRHARSLMHVWIAIPRWRGKRSRHPRRMRNPYYYVSGKKPMGFQGTTTSVIILVPI